MMTGRLLGATLLAVAAGCVHAYATPTFTVIPASGDVAAGPGETTGWGFTIANDTPYYLLIDSSAFCGLGGDPFLTDCTDPYNPPTAFGPAIGTYTDFIASNLTIVSPYISVSTPFVLTQNFDPVLQTGAGSYTINAGPLTQTLDTGNLFISYQEYDGDPLSGSATQVSGDIELSAAVTVQAIPEPATLDLAGSALLLFGWSAIRRRRRANR